MNTAAALITVFCLLNVDRSCAHQEGWSEHKAKDEEVSSLQDVSNSEEVFIEEIPQDERGSISEEDYNAELKSAQKQFTAMLLKLFDGDDLYREERYRGIIDALKQAFLTTNGNINHEYIDNVLRVVKQWDDEKKRQFRLQEMNKLDISDKEFDEFVAMLMKGQRET